jgi:hypothetical protein
LNVIALPASNPQYATWIEAAIYVTAASAIVGMLIFVASCAVDILKADGHDPPETQATAKLQGPAVAEDAAGTSRRTQ